MTLRDGDIAWPAGPGGTAHIPVIVAQCGRRQEDFLGLARTAQSCASAARRAAQGKYRGKNVGVLRRLAKGSASTSSGTTSLPASPNMIQFLSEVVVSDAIGVNGDCRLRAQTCQPVYRMWAGTRVADVAHCMR